MYNLLAYLSSSVVVLDDQTTTWYMWVYVARLVDHVVYSLSFDHDVYQSQLIWLVTLFDFGMVPLAYTSHFT